MIRKEFFCGCESNSNHVTNGDGFNNDTLFKCPLGLTLEAIIILQNIFFPFITELNRKNNGNASSLVIWLWYWCWRRGKWSGIGRWFCEKFLFARKFLIVSEFAFRLNDWLNIVQKTYRWMFQVHSKQVELTQLNSFFCYRLPSTMLLLLHRSLTVHSLYYTTCIL